MNVTDRPIIIDDAGRSLGGGEFGAVDPACNAVSEALAQGFLRLQPESMARMPDVAPQAAAVHKQVGLLNERIERLANMPVAEVEKLTKEKDDSFDPLVELVRDTNIELPPKNGDLHGKSKKNKDDDK